MAKDPVYVATKDAYHTLSAGELPEELPDGARHAFATRSGYGPIEVPTAPVPDPKAKPKKPPGWTPPDVKKVLRAQGWVDAGELKTDVSSARRRRPRLRLARASGGAASTTSS